MAKEKNKKSDMMTHYCNLKEQYQDCVLFYRLGDFYELFNEDAISMSKVLDLTLTGKDCGLEERAPMCGIPHHAADTYIQRLINLGYKVAICEQLPDKIGKMIQRDVVRVVTPGTVVDAGVIDDQKYNYIACIYQSNNNIGVCVCEVSTGEFIVSEFDGDKSIERLNDILIRYLPSEIIYCGNSNIQDTLPAYRMGALPDFTEYNCEKYTLNNADSLLSKYFGINYAADYDIKNLKNCQIAGGAMLSYLEETQKRTLTHINKIKLEKFSEYMQIDLNTRKNLEILETLKDRRKKGALLSVIDKTKTTMGSRLIKNWIQEPLYNEKEINSRLDAVEELTKKIILRDKIRNTLSNITDIERISGRIAYGNFTPKDAVSLNRTIELLPQLKELLSSFQTKKLSEFADELPILDNIQTLLSKAIKKDPPAVLSNGDFINDGFDELLDEYRNIKNNGQSLITELELKEQQELNLPSIKIKFNRVYGYYIELNKNFAGVVPHRYVRKQTVANFDRYITDELAEIQDKILNADENAVKREQELFKKIRLILLENCTKMQTASHIIAQLDCLMSFADVSIKNNYVKPKVSNKIKHITIEEGRHPVVEDINKSSYFIPNDTNLDTDENKIMIITGPNMAGKSTYMRQVAIITLLSHIGCFVPAKRAEIALTDKIFTRVGASDDLALGQSTFMVEMMEVANILNNATQNSLVILDEIGRGTSTFDGLSIAWSVVEEIATNMKCKTLFATHYHELTELEGFMSGVKNFKIAIKEINGSLVFLRKIQRGGANRSYGIEVAELAGVPKKVIVRAKEISKQLENNNLSNQVIKNTSSNLEEIEQKTENYMGIISILKDLDINKITPLGAFDTLCDLVQKVK